MYTNADVRQKFRQGISGIENQSGSMETTELPNGNLGLVGYGHALYAERNPSGEITVYQGWTEWANNQSFNAEATPRHIRAVTEFADRVEDRNPSLKAPPESIAEIGRMGRNR